MHTYRIQNIPYMFSLTKDMLYVTQLVNVILMGLSESAALSLAHVRVPATVFLELCVTSVKTATGDCLEACPASHVTAVPMALVVLSVTK